MQDGEMRTRPNDELYKQTEGRIELVNKAKLAVLWTFTENEQRQSDKKISN